MDLDVQDWTLISGRREVGVGVCVCAPTLMRDSVGVRAREHSLIRLAAAYRCITLHSSNGRFGKACVTEPTLSEISEMRRI